MTDQKKIEEQSTQKISRRNVLKAAVVAGRRGGARVPGHC